jgi:hypothetical protein
MYIKFSKAHNTHRYIGHFHINNINLPQQDVKYLGLHLDRKLTWHKHISTKQNQLGMTPKCSGYMSRHQNSPQATKFPYTKQCSNQSGSYGIQLWGTAYDSNTEILEYFQSNNLHMNVVDAT